jgi:predicted ribosome quality control (RQC) complex YloA/Tae2 family protein
MGMSYHEIEAIVSELKHFLTNGWVQKIYQPNEFALTLGIVTA